MKFAKIEDLDCEYQRCIKKNQKKLKRVGLLSSDEFISGVLNEEGLEEDLDNFLMDLETIEAEGGQEGL